MRWEKEIDVANENFNYCATIIDRESNLAPVIYDIEIRRVFRDGSFQVMLNGWHYKLNGAKRIFDKDYSYFGKSSKWKKHEDF